MHDMSLEMTGLVVQLINRAIEFTMVIYCVNCSLTDLWMPMVLR